jgi:CHAT domain
VRESTPQASTAPQLHARRAAEIKCLKGLSGPVLLTARGAEEEGTVGLTVDAYEELKLRIGHAAAGGYQVIATSSAGEASGYFSLPFNGLEVENFVLRVSRARGRRSGGSPATEAAKRFGGELFQAVFQGEVRDVYRDALARAQERRRGLRMTLCLSDAPDLMDVPWEYLYDAPDFLATSAQTPVVRYLDLPRGYRALKVDPPLRILGMISNPKGWEQLDVEKERADLEEALAELVSAGAIEIEWLERPTLSLLLRTLQSRPFHVLHFVGHGSYDDHAEQGILFFEHEDGLPQPVTGDKLAALLRDFTSLRLAVLNACEGARTSRTDPFAGVATSLVQRDIPAVIAMQFEITDVSAIVFADGFYRALASGAPVDAALAAARLAIFAERSDDIEWGTPVLFMRVADGRIFEVPEPVVEDGQAAAAGLVAPPPVSQGRGAPTLAAPGAPDSAMSTGQDRNRPLKRLAALTTTISRRARAIAAFGVVAVAAIIVIVVLMLGGGSGDLNTPAGRQVAGVIRTFLHAAANDKADTACGQLTPAERSRLAASLGKSTCAAAVHTLYAFDAQADLNAKVNSVNITGNTATATATTDKRFTLTLVRARNRWLINAA